MSSRASAEAIQPPLPRGARTGYFLHNQLLVRGELGLPGPQGIDGLAAARSAYAAAGLCGLDARSKDAVSVQRSVPEKPP